MMDMPLFENLEDIKEIVDGKPRRRAHNQAVARALLDEIVRKYPEMEKDGNYSKEIIEWALDRRMIEENEEKK